MFMQTLQDIISEINIERIKSKDSAKTNDLYQRTSQRQFLNNQVDNQTSTKSISPDYQRSCNGRCNNRSNTLYSTTEHKIYRKKWTKKQQQLLCNLIGRYGSDFTFLQTQFPNKTRKQLKKKYQQIHKNKQYLNKIQKIEESIIRQRRKSLFDDEIMEINSINSSEEEKKKDHQVLNQRCNIDIQQESQVI